MEDLYRFTALYLQGQADEANWVTAFKLLYKEDETSNWTIYQDSMGEYVGIVFEECIDYGGTM